MWFAWTIGGFLQVASKRYFISNWRFSDWIHALSGTFIIGATIYSCFDLFLEYGFTWKVHPVIGTVGLVMSIVVGLTGLFTILFSRYSRWVRFDVSRIFGSIHCFFGYLTLILCVVVNSGGMITYASNFQHSKKLYSYAFYNFYLIIAVLLTSEIVYRCWRKTRENSKFILNKNSKNKILVKEFALRAAKGENLIILENLVLDFSDYA